MRLNNNVIIIIITAGQLQGAGGRKVHAGISPVHLSWLPPSEAAAGCIYAQSSKALMLKPATSTSDTGW